MDREDRLAAVHGFREYLKGQENVTIRATALVDMLDFLLNEITCLEKDVPPCQAG